MFHFSPFVLVFYAFRVMIVCFSAFSSVLEHPHLLSKLTIVPVIDNETLSPRQNGEWVPAKRTGERSKNSLMITAHNNNKVFLIHICILVKKHC